MSALRLVDGFAYVGALRFAKYDIIFSNAVQSERGLNRKKSKWLHLQCLRVFS